jgi:putative ABC transport system permease protein
MLRNYLKIAWRNLVRNKAFSAINIIGLAMGLACFILITLYVTDELSFDRFNEKANRIYRVDSDIKIGGSSLKLAVMSDPMGATLKRDYPEVEAYTRFFASYSRLVKKGNSFISEANVVHADSTLFDVFTIPFLQGEPKHALTEPQSVVITESAAKKYFGTTDAAGKSIEIKEGENHFFKVTGVIKDFPKSASFHFDFIMSMHNVDYQFGNYLSNNFPTFIVLKQGTDYKKFEKNFKQVINKYLLPQAKEFMQINSMDEFEKGGNKLEIFLTPLTSIHLHSDKMGEFEANSNIQYVYIFTAVALFVLLIACINFMNLSTARSANRSREVGIRKVLGSERKSLIGQFLVESIITVLIALVFAIMIAALVMPLFNDISAKQLTISSLLTGKIGIVLLLIPFVVGALAGSYPALYMSAFKPIAVLKGKLNTGFNKSTFRSILVVFQFAVSVILIIGTIIIYRQLNYIQTTKLGFNRDQVLVVNTTNANGDEAARAFKTDILQLSGVKSGTTAGYLPVANSARSDNTFSTGTVMDSHNALNMQNWQVDYDYMQTLGMELVKGRNFSKDFGSDSSAIIINETAQGLTGFKDAVGKTIYGSDGTDNKLMPHTIIGVVKNFHYESLRSNIGPLCLRLGNSNWQMAFKIGTNKIAPLLSQVESKYKTIFPGMPFSYQFLDDSFDQMYRAEQRAGKVALIFAVLTVMIACLGLFGLATYMAEQRTKEIGVRKVLGASVSTIVNMLSKDFLKLVAIATVIAIPTAWLAMHRWLQDFAYRTDLGWWIFAISALVVAVIAIATVSTQAVKAALANPVKSLRSE